MNREQMEHIIRAANNMSKHDRFLLFGSQAALTQYPRLPGAMSMSFELDMNVQGNKEAEEVIEAMMGSMSSFDATHGYFVDTVGENTARLPNGWKDRKITYDGILPEGVIVVSPEINDLALSKLLAGREKDLKWLETGVSAGIISPTTILNRLSEVEWRHADESKIVRRRVDELAKYLPTTDEAMKIHPSKSKDERRKIVEEMDDVALLRQIKATEMAAALPQLSTGDVAGYKEANKEFRRAAVSRMLLNPEPAEGGRKPKAPSPR